MRREIEFRARNANVPRCWIYGYFTIENGMYFIINKDGKFPVIAGTLGQYIGLRDKNNVKIYDGDVVFQFTGNDLGNSRGGIIGEVKESEFGGSWEPVGHGMVDGRKRPEWKIVGNVHETPELLKGAKRGR